MLGPTVLNTVMWLTKISLVVIGAKERELKKK